MSKKKKRNFNAKRSARAIKKDKKKLRKKRIGSQPTIQYISRAAISEIDAPPGFRAVSISQGMVEYAKPLMDFVNEDIVKDPREALQLAMPIWNYNISLERPDSEVGKEDIIKRIEKILHISYQEANEFFEMMIQRKAHLFPEEVQSTEPLTMFIRKEKHYLISEFDYDSLYITDKVFTLNNEDNKLVQSINRMDRFITEGAEYEEWEEHYFEMEEKCIGRFEKWLRFRKVKEQYCQGFPFNVSIYLNFIYRYEHQNDINLKTVLPSEIEEFFVDHVLRKATVEPHEYVNWPPALKLFYNFLLEIEYLDSCRRIIELLDGIEPIFLRILRTRYS